MRTLRETHFSCRCRGIKAGAWQETFEAAAEVAEDSGCDYSVSCVSRYMVTGCVTSVCFIHAYTQSVWEQDSDPAFCMSCSKTTRQGARTRLSSECCWANTAQRWPCPNSPYTSIKAVITGLGLQETPIALAWSLCIHGSPWCLHATHPSLCQPVMSSLLF